MFMLNLKFKIFTETLLSNYGCQSSFHVEAKP